MKSSIKFLALVVVVLAGAGALWQFVLSPEAKRAAQVREALSGLATATATQDAAKVHAYLDSIISDKARISLEVRMSVPGQKENPQPGQYFGKQEFLSFIDNTLYTLKDYKADAQLSSFALSKDKSFGSLAIRASGEAKGTSALLMEASMPFSISGDCTGQAGFPSAEKAELRELSCVVRITR